MKKYIRLLRRFWCDLQKSLQRRAATSAVLSRLYYCFASSKFSREQKAVLAGKAMFNERRVVPRGSSSILRRNIHRLEKGLVASPRREVFAVDYIDETVTALELAISSRERPEPQELDWAWQVLNEYFKTAGSHEKIDAARQKFQALQCELHSPIPTRSDKRIPYHRSIMPPRVRYDDLLDLARHRRSVRSFLQSDVPHSEILRAVEIASLSPSACNRQPFRFVFLTDKEKVQIVASLPPGIRGYASSIPCIGVIIGQQRYFFDERDRHLIYIDSSLATMALVMALETIGLASCCVNWQDIESQEQIAERILQLDQDERPIMFLAIGYPDCESKVPYSEKRSALSLCTFNPELGERRGPA